MATRILALLVPVALLGCRTPIADCAYRCSANHTCPLSLGLQCGDDDFCHNLNHTDEDCRPKACVQKIAIGTNHACALKLDGSLWCWGRNDQGQLAQDLAMASSSTPVPVFSVDDPVDYVAAANGITCVIKKSDGTVWCWGEGAAMQINPQDVTTPANQIVQAILPDHHTAKWVAVGAFHSCVVADDQYTYCWGINGSKDINIDPDDTPLPPGRSSLMDRATEIVVGSHHTCGLSQDQVMRCWGGNTLGQLGLGTTSQEVQQPTQTLNPIDFPNAMPAHIFASAANSCALTVDNRLFCWGLNVNGQLAAPVSMSVPLPMQVMLSIGGAMQVSFRSVAVGDDHMCGVTLNGNLYCWGNNKQGQLGVSNTTAIAPSGVAVTTPPGLDGATAVFAGLNVSCAIGGDGLPWCWGDSTNGKLGRGDDPSSAPDHVALTCP